MEERYHHNLLFRYEEFYPHSILSIVGGDVRVGDHLQIEGTRLIYRIRGITSLLETNERILHAVRQGTRRPVIDFVHERTVDGAARIARIVKPARPRRALG